MKCLIRKATNNDIEELRELYLALEEDGVRYQPEHFVVGERTEEFFQSIFDNDNQDILVADQWKSYRICSCYDPSAKEGFVSETSKCCISSRFVCSRRYEK